MTIDERRAHERERYARLLAMDPLYGDDMHARPVLPHLLKMEPKSVLDVGCGSNRLCRYLREQGIPACGVDFADKRADVIAPAHDLGELRGDILTSFDMLEHVIPEELDDVFFEWRRVSNWFMISIAHTPAVQRPKIGQLHLIVKPESWWRDKLNPHVLILERLDVKRRNASYWWGKWRWLTS